MLAEFAGVVDAMRCAAEIQRAMIDRDGPMPDERRISFRIGINLTPEKRKIENARRRTRRTLCWFGPSDRVD
jgi:class 3 adenylate cyclase